MARCYFSAGALVLTAPTLVTEGSPESETRLGNVARLDSNDVNSTATVPSSAAVRNPWQNLQAHIQLAKFRASLIYSAEGKPLLEVSRWARCKSFTFVADAEPWLKRVGGPNA